MTIKPDGEQQQVRAGQRAQIRGQARHAEEDRHEERDDQATQLRVDVAAQNRRLADENSRHESAEDGVHADGIGDRAP